MIIILFLFIIIIMSFIARRHKSTTITNLKYYDELYNGDFCNLTINT